MLYEGNIIKVVKEEVNLMASAHPVCSGIDGHATRLTGQMIPTRFTRTGKINQSSDPQELKEVIGWLAIAARQDEAFSQPAHIL